MPPTVHLKSHVNRQVNDYRENRFSVAYTTYITGLHDGADGIFAPYKSPIRGWLNRQFLPVS